uniref:NADH-ubiquinone oxidoreductase chain 4L n=1 Tax=Armadillidium album TaxID=96802 RepID=A0A1P8DKJ2_9CRUS|nr:NADH dehydrogenase subunit 4L [Armadillidium album]
MLKFTFMNSIQMSVPMFMFFMALIVFFLVFKHVLSSLISLEFMALAMFSMLTFHSMFIGKEMFMSFFFVSITVCEAALGLSMVILLACKKGNDLFSNY